MMKDPRRRFTYAFTVEDTIMRLWYCDRAHFIVSQPFDFVTVSHPLWYIFIGVADCLQDYQPLFRFLLGCTFAEPHELGFDPTMTLVGYIQDVLQYEIVVRSHTGEDCLYRTSRVVFDGGSDNVISKGTRVWQALQVDSTTGETIGEPVIIKDSWVGRHREREGDIVARIRQSASSLNDSDRVRLEDSLVTILHHGDVFITGQTDCTRSTTWQTTKVFNNLLQGEPPSHTTIVQVHYRAVYKEVCQPLREVPCLATAFASLAEVCNSR